MLYPFERIERFRDYSSSVAFNQKKRARYLEKDFTDEDWGDYLRHTKYLYSGIVYYRFVLTGSRDETEDFVIRMLAKYQGSRANLKASHIKHCLNQILGTGTQPEPKGWKYSKLYEVQYLIIRSILRERPDMKENFSHFLDFANELYVSWHSREHTPQGAKYDWKDDFYY